MGYEREEKGVGEGREGEREERGRGRGGAGEGKGGGEGIIRPPYHEILDTPLYICTTHWSSKWVL
jgi:hypothetical protein